MICIVVSSTGTQALIASHAQEPTDALPSIREPEKWSVSMRLLGDRCPHGLQK